MSIFGRKKEPLNPTVENPLVYERYARRQGDAVGELKALVDAPLTLGGTAMVASYQVKEGNPLGGKPGRSNFTLTLGGTAMVASYQVKEGNPLGWKDTDTRNVIGTVDVSPVKANWDSETFDFVKPETYTLVEYKGHALVSGGPKLVGLYLISKDREIRDASSVLDEKSGLRMYTAPVIGEYDGPLSPVCQLAAERNLPTAFGAIRPDHTRGLDEKKAAKAEGGKKYVVFLRAYSDDGGMSAGPARSK